MSLFRGSSSTAPVSQQHRFRGHPPAFLLTVGVDSPNTVSVIGLSECVDCCNMCASTAAVVGKALYGRLDSPLVPAASSILIGGRSRSGWQYGFPRKATCRAGSSPHSSPNLGPASCPLRDFLRARNYPIPGDSTSCSFPQVFSSGNSRDSSSDRDGKRNLSTMCLIWATQEIRIENDALD